MKSAIRILVLLGVLLCAIPAAAQTPVTVKIFGFDAGKFPTVRAFVSVTDANGRAIQALKQEQFKLVEDGRNAEIVAINVSNDPIHVGMLIDHSGSMGQPTSKLNDARTAASAFVDQMRAQDEAFVTMFDNNTVDLQDFTNDHALLQRAIQKIDVGGGTSFYDAVYTSALKFESRKDQRKNAIIVLSDGVDNREEQNPLAALFGSPGSKHTLDEAIAKVNELKLAVYTIGLGSDADTSRLQKMATATGGKFYAAPNSSELKELYQRIAEQLQKEYAVDFKSPRAYADGTQRQVQVTITLADGTTQTVNGIYVAGFLFNRIHADWLIGAFLGLILLTLGVTPGLLGLIFKPRAPAPQPAPTSMQAPQTQPPATMPCPRCGRPVRVGARFCGNCRTPLGAPTMPPPPPIAPQPPRCPNCGNPVRAGAKFCGTCRARLG